MPAWWNGRHRRLKISWPKGRAGSSPAAGTTEKHGKTLLHNTRITLDSLSCKLGSVQALDNISASLTEKRIGILGRNGSGKSTLARAISGLIVPETGRVDIDGVNLAEDRKAAISLVGVLFQNPDHQIIFPTVEEEISFGLRQQGHSKEVARERTTAMLAQFGREAWLTRSIATLSQGQRHLICLMAVLVMEPSVIVLDEPFAGLDIPTTRALLNHLDALPQMLVHITHDPASVAQYDRLLWLDQGRLMLDGPPAQVTPEFLSAMEGAPDVVADL